MGEKEKKRRPGDDYSNTARSLIAVAQAGYYLWRNLGGVVVVRAAASPAPPLNVSAAGTGRRRNVANQRNGGRVPLWLLLTLARPSGAALRSLRRSARAQRLPFPLAESLAVGGEPCNLIQ